MEKINQRLTDLGYILPAPFAVQDDMAMVRVIGNRCVSATIMVARDIGYRRLSSGEKFID